MPKKEKTNRDCIIDPRTRLHFGIKRLGEFTSDTTLAYETMIQDAILDNAMVALIADYGSGKTHLMRRVKTALADRKDCDVTFISVADDQDNDLRMGSIMQALAIDLCNQRESPKRGSEARSRQVQKLLGMRYVNNDQHTCLVIEDAHRLHPNTISGLKLLREKDFLGVFPLFSIVMIGWPKLETRIENRRDILTRTQILRMDEASGWWTVRERRAYLDAVYNGIIQERTRDRLATRHRVPSELDKAVAEGLRDARLNGFERLDERTVRPSSLELYESLKARGISLSQIGSQAGGLSTSSVWDAVETGRGKNVEAVEDAMLAIAIGGDGQAQLTE